MFGYWNFGFGYYLEFEYCDLTRNFSGVCGKADFFYLNQLDLTLTLP
jgi:hypothetical protein